MGNETKIKTKKKVTKTKTTIQEDGPRIKPPVKR
jgi:hypothetical protein